MQLDELASLVGTANEAITFLTMNNYNQHVPHKQPAIHASLQSKAKLPH